MKRLFKEHLINAKYNRHTPVYVNPSNPRCYILLTVDACQEWAKALVSPDLSPLFWLLSNDISFFFSGWPKGQGQYHLPPPPRTLAYINLSEAKHAWLSCESMATTSTSAVNNSKIQLLAALLGGRNRGDMTPTISRTGCDSTLSSPQTKPTLKGILTSWVSVTETRNIPWRSSWRMDSTPCSLGGEGAWSHSWSGDHAVWQCVKVWSTLERSLIQHYFDDLVY
jgi:hypothetical protein